MAQPTKDLSKAATTQDKLNRHTLLMALVRKYPLHSQEEIKQALDAEHQIRVGINTIRTDLKDLPIRWDRMEGHYVVDEFDATREVIYDDLKDFMKASVHDIYANKMGSIVLFDTDFGVAERLAWLFWTLRMEEMQNMRREHHIAGVSAWGDQVQVFFLERKWGYKFSRNMRGLWGRPTTYDRRKDAEEEEFYKKVDAMMAEGEEEHEGD